MNGLNVWLRAQVYNLIIGFAVLLFIALFGQHTTDDIGIGILIYFVFIAISFVLGCLLIPIFCGIDYVINKITIQHRVKIFLQLIFYPLATFTYLLLIAYIFFVDSYTSLTELLDGEILLFALPSVISTFLSVAYWQYQDNKNMNAECTNTYS